MNLAKSNDPTETPVASDGSDDLLEIFLLNSQRLAFASVEPAAGSVITDISKQIRAVGLEVGGESRARKLTTGARLAFRFVRSIAKAKKSASNAASQVNQA